MSIAIHPNAAARIDRLWEEFAEPIVRELVQNEPPVDAPEPVLLRVNGWQVPIEFGHAITDEGDVIDVMFVARRQTVRLEGDRFRGFRLLVQELTKVRSVRELVSTQTLEETALRWLKGRLSDERTPTMTQFILEHLASQITTWKLTYPLPSLSVAGELGVNDVVIRTLTPQEMEEWREKTLATGFPEDRFQRTQLDEWGREFGNQAAAFVTVLGERRRAEEIAFQRVDEVISVLNTFSPAMLRPRLRSHLSVHGMESVQTISRFFEDENGITQYLSTRAYAGALHWRLGEQQLLDLARVGLWKTLELLELRRTSFRKDVIRALMLYSRAAPEGRLESKVLHVLVALEFLLLRDENEPVTFNVTRRFTYYIGGSLTDKKRRLDRTRSIYKMRSQYVHHGHSIEDIEILQAFLRDAWTFFRRIVWDLDRFRTRLDFVATLEDEMLSGPSTSADA